MTEELVPRLLERQERERIKVTEWLAEPGDEVVKGQPLVVLEMGEASWTLAAPATGIFVREVRHRGDRVELGDTLGYVEIVLRSMRRCGKRSILIAVSP